LRHEDLSKLYGLQEIGVQEIGDWDGKPAAIWFGLLWASESWRYNRSKQQSSIRP
jgi:hypothetical protein